MTGDRAASEDLVREVFVRILKYRKSFRERGEFTAWMFALARNVSADHFGRRPKAPLADEAELEAVAHDPNDNVRLAAIDALAGVAGRPGVQRELIASFPRQESPLVQIALVDLLAEARGARPRLQRLAADPDVDPTVRDYLRRRLERRT